MNFPRHIGCQQFDASNCHSTTERLTNSVDGGSGPVADRLLGRIQGWAGLTLALIVAQGGIAQGDLHPQGVRKTNTEWQAATGIAGCLRSARGRKHSGNNAQPVQCIAHGVL